MFFFEKKNQKTFIFDVACAAGVPGLRIAVGAPEEVEVFASFFQKRRPCHAFVQTAKGLKSLNILPDRLQAKPAAAAANRLKKGLLF